MLLKVKIVNKLSQVRKEPFFGSNIVSVLEPVEGVQYDATRMYRGWYFLKELSAWAEAADLVVTETIEPFDPSKEEDGYGGTADVTDQKNTSYSAEQIRQIIAGINESIYSINSSKIKFTDGDQEYPLLTYLKMLNNSFANTEEAVKKMNNIPPIPKADSATNNNSVLMIKKSENTEGGGETISYEWSLVDQSMLTGTPELDSRYVNEF